MSEYHCGKCDRVVKHKNRGLIFFIFWPWSMIFMKKRCPHCDSVLWDKW